jgi:DNA-3-methyladenine glycosylase II
MNSSEIQNGINQILVNDKNLAKIILLAGPCGIKSKRDYYLSFLRSIIGQQLSITVARVIYKRFMDFFNGNPLPEKILETPDDTLRKLGLSWAKAGYVKDLSKRILDEEIHFRGLKNKADDEIIAEFTKIKGVGVWTVQMFLIFTLGRLNILPLNDLGIRKGAMLVYKLRKLPDESKLIYLSRKFCWSPYNSVASWYLWKSLEIKTLI